MPTSSDLYSLLLSRHCSRSASVIFMNSDTCSSSNIQMQKRIYFALSTPTWSCTTSLMAAAVNLLNLCLAFALFCLGALASAWLALADSTCCRCLLPSAAELLFHLQAAYWFPVSVLVILSRSLPLRRVPCQLPRIPAVAGMALRAGKGGRWISAMGVEGGQARDV